MCAARRCAQKRRSSARCAAVCGTLPLPGFAALPEIESEPPVSRVGEVMGWVDVPDAEVTLADVTVAVPGHHAKNRPLPTVAPTREPLLNVKVAADTPEPVEPSATV